MVADDLVMQGARPSAVMLLNSDILGTLHDISNLKQTVVNIVAADDLVMQGAKPSAATVLTFTFSILPLLLMTWFLVTERARASLAMVLTLLYVSVRIAGNL